MKIKNIFWGLLAFGVLVPVSVGAATFAVSEEDVSTSAAVADDLFIAGNGVMVDDDVAQDVFAGGQAVTIQSQVGGDVFAGGNFVHVKGVVGDDVMAAGEKVEITAASVDDVFVAGNRVDISSGTVVNGSVFAAGQTVTIAGTVKGNVRMAGENMVIKSGATVEGDLITYGEKQPVVEEGAKVLGEKTHKVSEARPVKRMEISRWVGSVVAWFVVSLVLLYAAPGYTKRVVEAATKRSGKAILVGVLWALVFVPVVIMLMVTVVGIPLAVLVALATVLGFMLAIAYAMITVGVWIINRIAKSDSGTISWQHVLLGVVVFKVVRLVPIVGWPATVVVTLLALGALAVADWQLLRGDGKITSTEQNA